MKRLVYILLTLFLASGCLTTVSLINKKPQKYHNKQVVVYGRVISSIQLIDILSFTIKAGRRKIMVVTPNYLPLKRDRLIVKGKVNANYEYNKKKILVILEKKKKNRKKKNRKSPKPQGLL